jgi:hypothetical protein
VRHLVDHVDYAPRLEHAVLYMPRCATYDLPIGNAALVRAVCRWVAAHPALRRVAMDFALIDGRDAARLESNREFDVTLLTGVLAVAPPHLHHLHLRCSSALDGNRLRRVERTLRRVARGRAAPLRVTWDLYTPVDPPWLRHWDADADWCEAHPPTRLLPDHTSLSRI